MKQYHIKITSLGIPNLNGTFVIESDTLIGAKSKATRLLGHFAITPDESHWWDYAEDCTSRIFYNKWNGACIDVDLSYHWRPGKDQ